MQHPLTDGQSVDVVGTVGRRWTFVTRNGPAVKATLHAQGDDELTVVWWEAGLAPQSGDQVRVQGKARMFNGAPEVHAQQTMVDRNKPPEDELVALVGFFRDCVEAEAAGSLRLVPGSRDHIEIAGRKSPFHASISVSDDPESRDWCERRARAVGETQTAGWPLILGRTSSGPGDMAASPLLLTEVRLHFEHGTWRCERPGEFVELNPFALDLLGFARDEREAVVKAVDESAEVEEASSSGARAEAILRVLGDCGVAGLSDLRPGALTPLSDGHGTIRNTGVLMATSGRLPFVRNLVVDLHELANRPELLRRGPATALLGAGSVTDPPLPEAHPTLVPSSLAQDHAVHAAMTNEFTVVTGPPGTGKSQVLVNVVAAAVCRGETVLLASKNNKAVDVVVDRLRETSPHGIVVRAGGAALRDKVADYIAGAISRPPRQVDPAVSRTRWTPIAERVRSVLEEMHERGRIEAEIAQLDDRLQGLAPLPPDILLEAAEESELDAGELLDRTLADVRVALDAFGSRLGLFKRWVRHSKRLEQAREMLRRLGTLLDLAESEVEECLASVADRPRRSFSPRRDFGPIEERVRTLLEVLACRRNIREARVRLGGLPPKHELDDRLVALSVDRVQAGRALLDARWEELRGAVPSARVAAGQYAQHLKRAAQAGSGAGRALGLIPRALPALPVWAVTNLSARTNLPLQPALFDLVVIDEASQCDVASALPLLVRAKRALIIGDQRQLIHVTSLSHARERLIARRWGLAEERAEAFSYRDHSCFDLAVARIGALPLFLDLHFRSHPAIIGFANTEFYDGNMELCSDRKPPAGLRAIEWVRVAGQVARGPRGRSRINRAEAEAVVRQVSGELANCRSPDLSIGVVTPYSAQAELVGELLAAEIGRNGVEPMTIATAHRFQGDECDVLYFSPVVDQSMTSGQLRFAADRNLINVALTRARRRLVIIGDIEACSAHETALSRLAGYVTRIEASGFDSPIAMELFEAILRRGVPARAGAVVAGHRIDIAVEDGEVRLDVECDGPAFPRKSGADSNRDRAVEADGWQVIRFSVRELSRDRDRCLAMILEAARP